LYLLLFKIYQTVAVIRSWTLAEAAQFGNLKALGSLVERLRIHSFSGSLLGGVNALDDKKCSALHWAAINNHADVCKFVFVLCSGEQNIYNPLHEYIPPLLPSQIRFIGLSF
jgi:hypothetical protein